MATEPGMETKDFNKVVVTLERLKALGGAITAISETDFPDDELRTLGFLIEDLAWGAYRIMCPENAAPEGGE